MGVFFRSENFCLTSAIFSAACSLTSFDRFAAVFPEFQTSLLGSVNRSGESATVCGLMSRGESALPRKLVRPFLNEFVKRGRFPARTPRNGIRMPCRNFWCSAITQSDV